MPDISWPMHHLRLQALPRPCWYWRSWRGVGQLNCPQRAEDQSGRCLIWAVALSLCLNNPRRNADARGEFSMTDSQTGFSRRGLLAASGGALVAGATGLKPAYAVSDVSGMPQEGPTTPKLTMYISADPTVSEMKKIKQ